MGRKKRVGTAALAGMTAATVAALFRRQRRRDTAAMMHDLASPPGVNSGSPDGSITFGDAHAPGHQHLAPPPSMSSPALSHRADRRWAQARRRSSGRTP